ncbi:GGDEF domain-containing protein [Pseudoalteromonas sp. MMG013]|uniref:GGDEF domain-containing protein n=1 Tax=unclassified Pseudoalteromonas TaxID=194690 RepID=UPI001B35BD22|nr:MULTISPECIES: GGDEF domain-containing protein [unclassified Pseudoalteromonas]MBQ4844554.1 GGDEF domain-containing protein [Pseudoalteromonas sp. MMG005]MBQ4849009.1 GGDEF domain-containing protein [Pseudoalteromonas sp. MMG012]MBQ4861025.1 GGDEF domain-containing protein [Pseudoalteromonas sp. MMG013]
MENVHILTQRMPTRGDYLPFSNEQFTSQPEPTHRLVEQLQTTLQLDEQLTLFADYAKRIIKLSGLQFHSSLGVAQMKDSDNQYTPYTFDLELNGEHLGQLVYFCQYQLSSSIQNKLRHLHSALLYPLRNALMYSRVLQLATKDSLTGLNNRSQFNDNLAQKLERSRRHHRSFSLMILDLDNFKAVNDIHGHKAGDDVLIEFANILKQSIRATDSVYRFGGDEFAVLIDDPEFPTNKLIAERIMATVQRCGLLANFGVTTSIGFTLAASHDCENVIFSRADKGLYKAKAAGRNCARAV